MNEALERKEPAIRAFVEHLTAAGHRWALQDHWSGDRCAVGLSRPKEPRWLACVSTWNQVAGRYHVELEVPSSSETYETTQVADAMSLDDAVAVVGGHLT